MEQKTFSTTVSAIGPRTSSFTISTGSKDRDGDTIDPKGWKLDNYRKSPVVLFGHDYTQLPIAKTTSIWTDSRGLHAEVEFPPIGVYPFADTVCDLVKGGFLNATSVGFLIKESRPTRTGLEISSAELLELSIVNLPSNPEALVMQRGLNATAVKRWLGSDTIDWTSINKSSEPEIDWDRISTQLASRPEVNLDTRMVDAVISGMVPSLAAGVLAIMARDATERVLNHMSGRID